MTQENIEEEEGLPRRFDVELFIRHPTLSPDEISDRLGLQPKIVHAVGAPRKTPKGTILGGNYERTA